VGTSTEERIARSLLYPSRAWAERYGERSRSAEWRCHQAEICRRHAFECLTKVKCRRCEARTEAVSDKYETEKRSVIRDLSLWTSCVDTSRSP